MTGLARFLRGGSAKYTGKVGEDPIPRRPRVHTEFRRGFQLEPVFEGHAMNKGIASTLIPVYPAAVAAVGSILAAVPAQADGGDLGGALLSEINATRAVNGCGPVAANPQLTTSAARHANDMLTNGVQGHIGSDGSSLVQRVADAGYVPYAAVGEVVYWSIGSSSAPAAAVTWWMNSPGHRAVITDCALTDAGFSAVSKGDEMTAAVDFGRK
jgi:uncharacterized protein YkwD